MPRLPRHTPATDQTPDPNHALVKQLREQLDRVAGQGSINRQHPDVDLDGGGAERPGADASQRRPVCDEPDGERAAAADHEPDGERAAAADVGPDLERSAGRRPRGRSL
jgi:hypothetical protein